MTSIYFIRHGSCEGLGKRLWGRTAGVGLNEKGRREVKKLAHRFDGFKLSAIYSGPLQRAIETAEAVGRITNVEITVDDAFHEVDFGEWTGKTVAELSTQELWGRFNQRRSEVTIPGGESFLDVQKRVVAGVKSLIQRHSDHVVVVVTHADLIKTIVLSFLGVPLDNILRFEIFPCSLTVLSFSGDASHLITLNNTRELPTCESRFLD